MATVRHQVALADDSGAYVPLDLSAALPQSPARSWPFTLDPFQVAAISCLERNESVLVAAHTSAGKTVVAEYAIALALSRNQRVIYTSPIKALSNQKWRELQAAFGDVGLMTGDVSLTPTASCLVMTTEVLRNMLYRGSQVVREAAWVIFDEVHYMRDAERGVVWEETLILLPSTVRFVFLSATIPNALQFATWVAMTHQQPCHVIRTDMRPTPLQHFVYIQGGDGLYLVVDEGGEFRSPSYAQAIAGVTETKLGNTVSGDCVISVLHLLLQRSMQPVIVFALSRKECEALAMRSSTASLPGTSLTDEETEAVNRVFNAAIACLGNEDDRSLPQIKSLLPLLRRGIGLHHSGLLPLLREIVELLFGEGLLRVLFATETFAIGLNMPARTVLFTGVKKFDGTTHRLLRTGEYTQMSGRAGRRGLDARGVSVVLLAERLEPEQLRSLMGGKDVDPLDSAFYLSYSTVLNLAQRGDAVCSAESLLQRSFFHFQQQSQLPRIQQELSDAEAERSSKEEEISRDDPSRLASFRKFHARSELLKEIRGQLAVLLQSHALPFLQAGRLARTSTGWACVISWDRSSSDRSVQLEVVHCDAKRLSTVSLKSVDAVSAVRISVAGTDDDRLVAIGRNVRAVLDRFSGEPPLLDPVSDVGIRDAGYPALVERESRLASVISEQMKSSSGYESLFLPLVEIERRCQALHTEKDRVGAVVHLQELNARRRVLRRLGYLSENGAVTLKGRVACEITGCTGGGDDELILAELLFDGTLHDLTSAQIVALLSAFVLQEPSDSNVPVPQELGDAWGRVLSVTKRIAIVSDECQVNTFRSGTNVVRPTLQLRPDLQTVMLAWCAGAKFREISEMTSLFEGSVVRCMRRLEELLRQLCQAARVIGSDNLEVTISQGIALLKRDIVFANSLYL